MKENKIAKLTYNERVTLHLLLENAKTSDKLIAKELGISSQAVGKIRKKLEKTVINSYTLNVNYTKLGVSIFAIALAMLNNKGIKKGEKVIEDQMRDNPHVIQLCKLPSSRPLYNILYGFEDMHELEEFFQKHERNKFHSYIENKEFFTFSHNNVLKNNAANLVKKSTNKK